MTRYAATAVTVVVMDVMLRGADAISDTVWLGGRGDTQVVFDGLAATVTKSDGAATTFIGPLSLLFGMVGLIVISAVLMMRSALLYLVAAFAPIVWASSVSPVMRIGDTSMPSRCSITRSCGTPRLNSRKCTLPSRRTVRRSIFDSALTHDTPTPCRPPETL